MATSGGAGGGSLRLMSCVRETSPLDIVDAEEPRHEPKKRRFHPFRGLRRMFRRKSRTPEVEPLSNTDAQSLEARSQSASQLLEDNKTRRRSGGNLQSSGLSVSHDSVFSPEQQSADSASELESTSSLSIQRLILAQSGIRAELVDAVRRRRSRGDQSDEEEDLGLPRSPCSNSPTTADVLFEKFPKEATNKSSHSTCSDGSLLSMGSSEMDEDSYGQSSRNSSKLSLQDKRNLVNSEISPTHGAPQLELGVGEVITTPLSHSAARHKMAVKPKRTHGAPRRRRMHAIGSLVAASSLPVTPEVNEDGSNSGRSVTPDIESNNVPKGSGDAVAVTTSVCISSITTNTATTPSSVQLKSSSLPPGLAPPSLNQWNEPSATPVKLSRSRSSATNRQLDPNSATESSSSISENDELDVDKHKKEDMSFFSRLLSRRSGKKKKGTDEKDLNETPLELPQKRMDEKGRYVYEMSKLNRNHPASRQRVEPINIPSECPTTVTRMHVSYSAPTPPLSPKSLKNDNDLLFKQPNNKVIPLSNDDLIHQRKSLLKKSNSFRSNNESDNNTQMFMSLDTKNTAINLQTNEKSDEFINSIGNNDDIDDKIQEEVINSIVNGNNSVGALNKNLVQDVTNSNLVLSTNESNDFTITTKSMVVNDTDVHNKTTSVSVNVKTPLVNDNNTCIEQINSDGFYVKNRVRNHSLNLDDNNEDTIDNTSHQITIPVGTSIVNIINESPNLGNDKISEIMNIKPTSPTSMINNTEDEKIKPPEPKIRTQNPIIVDDKPIAAAPVSLFMPPIPAPRLSKRDSLTLTPPIVPEFLRVQLHHIDKTQNKNVVLSKNLSIDSDKDDINDDIASKNCDEINKDSFVEMKSLDEVEIKQEQIIATSNVSSVPIITSIANKTCENVTKVTELKQKSVQPDQQPVPNPRYSVVSITTNSPISEQSKNKTENQIIRKKSIVKDVNGLITERIHNNTIISDKNNTTYDSKTNDDCSSIKNILRKKSFNKDISSNDDKSSNITSTSSNSKENTVQDPTECNEVTPKVILRQKSIKNDILIVDAQQKSKKPSLDISTCQPIVTKNTINDKSNEINVKEKYRNSFGSCDTLLSQDNTFQSEVVYRRKSLTSREVMTKQNDKDDEPELLKVFARRSLKIKDSDINLSNVNDLEMNHESSSSCTKSRDSDKENECGDSPPEERKKIKDNFNEAKTVVDNSDNVKTNLLRPQRSISLNSDDNNTNVNVLNTIHKENNQNSYEKRQRSRTFPDNHNIIDPPNNAIVINQNQKKPPIDKKPSDNLFKDNEIDVITKQENLTSSNNENINEDNGIPLFKRIQQRKEEWEKRAQLAMKRTNP